MRAPTYQSSTNAPSGSQTRLVAADNNGGVAGGIARGLKAAGQGLAQYAEAEFAIQEKHNDINARKLRIEMLQELQPLVSQYQTLKGTGAGEQAKAVREQITKARETYASKAGNERMKMRFEQITDDDVFRLDAGVVDHSIKEMWQAEWDTNSAELSMAQTEIAQNPLDKQKFSENLSMISAITGDLSRMAGDTPEMAENRLRAANDVAITTAVDGMLKSPNANLDMVLDFYESNRDLLSAKGISEIEGVLAEPRLNRALDDELDNYVSGTSPVAGADAVGSVSSSAPSGTATTMSRQTPATGPVTDDFGEHQARGSAGLDIAAPRGSAIKPVADGVVIEAGTGKTGGNFIRVQHADGTMTSYMHMGQPPAFKKGDRVTQSTVIGTVGSTGRASGPHLHLEVKDARGNQIDPEDYLKGASPIGSPGEPRIWDNAAVLEAIKRDEDAGKITTERADQLRSRFQRRVNVDADIINQRDNDAVRAAQEWMLVPGNLDNFTRYEQLPANVRAGFKPETALRFVEVARAGANAKAADNQKALKEIQDIEYARLTGLKSYDEDAFMALDLTDYAGKLSPTQWSAAVSAQQQMREKRQQGALTFLPGPKIKSTILSMSKMDGDDFKEGDGAFNSIATIMSDRANAFIKDNNGKLPSDADFMDFYRYATATTTGSQKLLGIEVGTTEARRFEFDETVEATAARNAETEARKSAARERNRLISGIRAQMLKDGIEPTAERIERRLKILQGQ